jgi:neutral ceramidase
MAAYLSPTSTSLPGPGPLPPDNRANSLSFTGGVVQDNAPIGKAFGSCITQPSASYPRGSVVSAVFVGANPRNNLRLEGTFAAIEQQINGVWTRVRSDADWFLVYSWKRTNWLLGYSEVTIAWETENYAAPGTYRVKYYGDSKNLIGKIKGFEGMSNSFVLS